MQSTPGATLRATMLLRALDGTERTLATVTSNSATVDGGAIDQIDAQISLDAVDAKCGEHLVVRVSLLAGDPIFELFSTLSVP